jgi:hypothetical protein
MILDPASLVITLDTINAAFLSGDAITSEEGLEAARWVVSRQGEKGSYRGMAAPTQADFTNGIRVFTGEKLICASARHIMGQEAARATWLLGHSDPTVRNAYDKATGWMHELQDFQQRGTFCCGRCTLAFWRHTWVGDFENKEMQLVKGLHEMKEVRLGDGKWRNYPFFYAIYTLSELDLEPARDELAYARPVMERYIKRTQPDVYSGRKIAILNKVLENLN